MSDVGRLLRARSVAIVGASNNPDKVGYRPVLFLLRFGFEGRIYPVNPRNGECLGLRCYPSLKALPEVPDVVCVIVAARLVPAVLQEAGDLGIRAAVVISAGFGESGEEGQELEGQIAVLARRYDMTVCGPNSVGLIYSPSRLTLTFTEGLTRGDLLDGHVGIVSQSGAFGTVIYAEARARGLGVRAYFSSGNEVTTRFSDYLNALVDDEGVSVIGGYLEGLRDGSGFARAAQRARAAGKPIVLLKVGSSENGRAAAQSHTGALAGDDRAYGAAFRRYGVIAVEDEVALLDTIEAFDTLPTIPQGDRVAVVTMSGGAGVLTSDLVDLAGLRMAKLSPAVQARLRQVLPSFATVDNPIDLTGQFVSNTDGLTEVLRLIAEDPEVDTLVAFSGLGWSAGSGGWIEALAGFTSPTTPLIAVVPLCSTEDRARLRASGVPAYESPRQAVNVAASLWRWASWCPADPVEALAPCNGLPDGTATLGEHDAKGVAASLGLRIPRFEIVSSADEAQDAANRLGCELVMKVAAPALHHKTEVGGVLVGVWPQDARAAFIRLQQVVTTPCPVRVEERVKALIECAVGVVRSEPLGHLVMVGVGGIAVEALQDVVFRLAPVSVDEARDMIRSLRSAALLEGWRGQPAGDVDALAEAVSVASRFATGLGDRLAELDFNPVAVMPKGEGAVVLDALLVLEDDG